MITARIGLVERRQQRLDPRRPARRAGAPSNRATAGARRDRVLERGGADRELELVGHGRQAAQRVRDGRMGVERAEGRCRRRGSPPRAAARRARRAARSAPRAATSSTSSSTPGERLRARSRSVQRVGERRRELVVLGRGQAVAPGDDRRIVGLAQVVDPGRELRRVACSPTARSASAAACGQRVASASCIATSSRSASVTVTGHRARPGGETDAPTTALTRRQPPSRNRRNERSFACAIASAARASSGASGVCQPAGLARLGRLVIAWSALPRARRRRAASRRRGDERFRTDARPRRASGSDERAELADRAPPRRVPAGSRRSPATAPAVGEGRDDLPELRRRSRGAAWRPPHRAGPRPGPPGRRTAAGSPRAADRRPAAGSAAATWSTAGRGRPPRVRRRDQPPPVRRQVVTPARGPAGRRAARSRRAGWVRSPPLGLGQRALERLDLGEAARDPGEHPRRRWASASSGAAPSAEPRLVRRPQALDERLLVGLGVVDEARQLVEAALAQPGVDDVDRRPLLAHEQDPLAAGDVVGDEVRDRLRLAGPGRSLDDEALAVRARGDRGDLRAVRRERRGSARRAAARRAAGRSAAAARARTAARTSRTSGRRRAARGSRGPGSSSGS